MSKNQNDLLIEDAVKSFYTKAREDILIGYFFQRLPDFEDHVEHITAFWHWQLLGAFSEKPRREMRLIPAHLELNLAKGHLDRFLFMFKNNLEEFELPKDLKTKWLAKLEFFKERLVATDGMFRESP